MNDDIQNKYDVLRQFITNIPYDKTDRRHEMLGLLQDIYIYVDDVEARNETLREEKGQAA